MDQQTVIFLGTQGSGKGTQVELLKQFLKTKDGQRETVFFEAGGDLRRFGEEEGYTQKRVDASLKRGELQPDFITLYLMSKLFLEKIHCDEHLIIDGFPRLIPQLLVFETAMQFYEKKPALIFLTISDEEAVSRLMKRGRNDDSAENIRKRLAWTREQVMPTVERIRESPLFRCFEINGERSPEEVHNDILGKLGLQ
jgi:adenylate kinase family enzyme